MSDPAADDLTQPSPRLGEDVIIPRGARQHQNFAPYLQSVPAMDDDSSPYMADRLGFVFAIVGLVLGSLALLFALPFLLYAALAGHHFLGTEQSVNPLTDPLAVVALLGTLLPLGLSGAATVLTLRNSSRVSTLVIAGCGIAVSLIAILLVLLGYQAMLTVGMDASAT